MLDSDCIGDEGSFLLARRADERESHLKWRLQSNPVRMGR
jgi:hypothetical protein